MHVVEHPGDAGAPVVLLIHGLLDSGASFDGVVRELVPEHTVVTYDRRGWGRSRGDAPPRSLAEQADDAVAALDGRRATVVGHSYGSVVGLMTAVRRPDLVASVAIFEPTVPWTDWWPDYDEMMRRSAELGPMFKRWSVGQARRTPDERAADDVSMARDFSFVEEPPFDFADVGVPCLVGGSVDTTPWDYESGARLAAIFDAPLVSFEDAGHTVHRTHPREFADFARRAVALARER
ncbi:MAG TPA: alpha/beta hydrolase [Acidimicrobiia bacterium]|nr:alpha/beta hydrolase [Acidimicrobiia bacterium]